MGGLLTDFLPTTKKELELRGWDYVDVILFSADAYVDHPSFGAAVIGRTLEAAGFRVAIVPQPDWHGDYRDFKKLGRPRLFFGISPGCMDSMVNKYTAARRLRSEDAYSPDGRHDLRPEYPTIVYSKILRELYPDVPIVLGGIEASLRRLTHYDYWQDRLRPCILVDSGADMITYGMGEKATIELARRVSDGLPIRDITDLPQTVFIRPADKIPGGITESDIVLHSHEECLRDKRCQAENFRHIEEQSNMMHAQRLIQMVAFNGAATSPSRGRQEGAAIEFKVTGKEILDPGWRVVREKSSEASEAPEAPDSSEKKDDEERTLPTFVKGESGDHKPTLTEKWTTPPPYYNEASLLRAMETAGKFVEDDELRAAMKENGIGRPSSRASIIETLFKRRYIKRDRKRLIATPTGIELIDLIREELLKSCELTGIWEKKLRDIEHQKYDARQFIDELKQQVTQIVSDVMADNTNRRVTVLTDAELKKVKSQKTEQPSKTAKKEKAQPSPPLEEGSGAGSDALVGSPCPLCGKGHIIKGKTAYGCSEWKNGCTWRQPFNTQ